MACCPIEGNPMAVRIYPTGGRVLAVMGASSGTNIPNQSWSCPDLTVYLHEERPICIAAVSLRMGTHWHSMFICIQLKDGCAVAEMEEPFVHPFYPTTFDDWRVCVQVAGEWYTTTTLNLVGKLVTAEAICRLLAGTMTEEAFLASAEGESLAEEQARLRRLEAQVRRMASMWTRDGAQDENPATLLEGVLQRQHDFLYARSNTIAVLVRLLNRLANEGCSLPNLSEPYARTPDDWFGRSETRWRVTSDMFERWIGKMRQHTHDSHQLERDKRWAQEAEQQRDAHKVLLLEVSSIALGRPVSTSELHHAMTGSESHDAWISVFQKGLQGQIKKALDEYARRVREGLGSILVQFEPKYVPETDDVHVDNLLTALKDKTASLSNGIRVFHEEVIQRRIPYFPQTVLDRLETVWPGLVDERKAHKRK